MKFVEEPDHGLLLYFNNVIGTQPQPNKPFNVTTSGGLRLLSTRNGFSDETFLSIIGARNDNFTNEFNINYSI